MSGSIKPIMGGSIRVISDTRRRSEKKPKPGDEEQPRLLNSCHAMRSAGEVVRQRWPKFYTGPDKQAVNE